MPLVSERHGMHMLVEMMHMVETWMMHGPAVCHSECPNTERMGRMVPLLTVEPLL
jgi:hypothetical protein